MSNFQDLTLAVCPLLTKDGAAVVDRFNQAARLFREIEQKYPALLERADVKDRALKLDGIRVRLLRKQYLVGFLGTTQSGKSTTFNNILGVNDMDAPAESGVAGATTSAITRLLKTDGDDHSLKLRYLSEAEFQAKRAALIEVMEGNKHWTNAEILSDLHEKRNRLKNGKASAEKGGADVLPADLDALECLLRSYEKFKGTHVREVGQEQTVPYAERSKYLNHAATRGSKVELSPNFLLKDAVIAFRTDRIPRQLEIIDLPGLGASGAVDTLLTMEFLGELDGAFVFISAERIENLDVERILARLKKHYEAKLLSRVWIVFTKFDGLGKNHLFGNKAGQTIVNTLKRFLDSHRIPMEQICLTSNRIFDKRRPDGLVPRETAVALLEGISSEAPIPPAFQAHPHLKQAFENLLNDGGVSQVRDLIANVLPREVAKEARQQADESLTTLLDDLQRIIEIEKQRQASNPAELLDAVNCWYRVREVINHWEARVEFLEPLGVHLQKGLLALLEKAIAANDQLLNQMAVHQMAALLESLAVSVQATVDDQMNTQIIEKVYAEVGSQLADLPKVRILTTTGPAEMWERFAQEDRRSRDWRSGFPTFSCKGLFAEMPAEFKLAEYRSLMQEKVRVGSHQAMHALKVRVRSRLDELLLEVSRLAFSSNGNIPATTGSL